jgi:ABC-type multidrug transport system fused ATPase/permease subunit
LLRKPRLLFLDEATSALDTENEALVQEALDMLIKTARCTVVLVAHRLSTVMNADLIAVINNGVVAEAGNHDTLSTIEGGLYAKLVSRQIKRAQNQIEVDEKALMERKNATKTADDSQHADVIDELLNSTT